MKDKNTRNKWLRAILITIGLFMSIAIAHFAWQNKKLSNKAEQTRAKSDSVQNALNLYFKELDHQDSLRMQPERDRLAALDDTVKVSVSRTDLQHIYLQDGFLGRYHIGYRYLKEPKEDSFKGLFLKKMSATQHPNPKELNNEKFNIVVNDNNSFIMQGNLSGDVLGNFSWTYEGLLENMEVNIERYDLVDEFLPLNPVRIIW